MRTLKIKDIGKVVSGSTPKTGKEEYWNGNIPWVTPKEMGQLTSQYLFNTERKITDLGFKSCSTTLIPKNNVLFTSRAPIGLVAVNKIDVCTNQGFKSIILNDGFDALYVYYYLKSKKDQLNNLGTGTTFKELSKSTFEKFEIPVPDYMHQIRIATLLSKAEVLVTQRKESIHLLDKYIKSVFFEMFGNIDYNKTKFPIGRIKNLISDVKYGTSKPAEESGQYPYLRMNNITFEGYMDYSSLKYINISEAEKEKYLVRKGDILFNRTNSKELVGKTGVFNEDIEMIIAGYLIRIRTNENADPWYLWGYLNSAHGKQSLQSMSKSIVGMANINANEVQSIQILLPPINLQKKFAVIVEKAVVLKKQYQQNLLELEKLFGTLSQLAFKGELNLSQIKSKSIDKEIERIVLGNKQTNPVITKPKKETEEDIRYGDPFDIDEAIAKKQGGRFYIEWLDFHGKSDKQKEESVWLQSKKNGKPTMPVKFNEAEGNAVIQEEFAKQNLGFSYQVFETFLKKEKITHTPTELKEFLFQKLEEKQLVQYFASKEWMEALRNPKFNPPGGSEFVENGSIWFFAPKTEKTK
jgi:type I restriction enzyme S subunit